MGAGGDPVHEVANHVGRLAGLQLGVAAEHLGEDRPELHPGKRRAEAGEIKPCGVAYSVRLSGCLVVWFVWLSGSQTPFGNLLCETLFRGW